MCALYMSKAVKAKKEKKKKGNVSHKDCSIFKCKICGLIHN